MSPERVESKTSAHCVFHPHRVAPLKFMYSSVNTREIKQQENLPSAVSDSLI